MVAKEHVAHAYTTYNVIKQLECVVMVAILEKFTYHLYVKQVTIFYMTRNMLLLYYAYQTNIMVASIQIYRFLFYRCR